MKIWRSPRTAEPGSTSGSDPTHPLPVVDAHPEYEAYARPRRRVRTPMAMAAMVASGAAVAYFGVSAGLATLTPDHAPAPAALPAMSTERDVSADGAPAGHGRMAEPRPAEPPAGLPAAPPAGPTTAPPPPPPPTSYGPPPPAPAPEPSSPPRTSRPSPPIPSPAPDPPSPTPSGTPCTCQTASPEPSDQPCEEEGDDEDEEADGDGDHCDSSHTD